MSCCTISRWKVIWGHIMTSSSRRTFLANLTFDRNELEALGWRHSVRLVKAHRLKCNMTYLGHTVTLTWRDLSSNFKIVLSRIKHVYRSGLTRGTRWCQNYSPSLSGCEVIHEKKHFPQNVIFIFGDLWYFQYQPDRQSQGMYIHIDSRDPMLSFGYLTILLACMIF